MISAVYLPFNSLRHILEAMLYEMATGTLLLTGETAGIVVGKILHQPPDSSRLPVHLRLIVLNRRHTASLPFGPGITGSVH
jgi:hypothetical protein